MSKRLYIGNLSYSTNDSALKAAFEKAGSVDSATVMMDRASGRSRGFAFVEMSDDASADKAIEMWNGAELDGRKLIVNEARPKTERSDRFDN